MAVRPVLKCFKRESICAGAPYMVYYAKFDGERYVYSTDPEGRVVTSSINAAEDIISDIARREGINALHVRWFDLQTQRAYTSKQPGEFEFEQVHLQPVRTQMVRETEESTILTGANEDGLSMHRWQPMPCPTDIVAVFAQLIGPHPHQERRGLDPDPNAH